MRLSSQVETECNATSIGTQANLLLDRQFFSKRCILKETFGMQVVHSSGWPKGSSSEARRRCFPVGQRERPQIRPFRHISGHIVLSWGLNDNWLRRVGVKPTHVRARHSKMPTRVTTRRVMSALVRFLEYFDLVSDTNLAMNTVYEILPKHRPHHPWFDMKPMSSRARDRLRWFLDSRWSIHNAGRASHRKTQYCRFECVSNGLRQKHRRR